MEKGFYEHANLFIRKGTLQFFISNGDVEFLTSDNPSFDYAFGDGLSHVMPLTPKILVRVLKGSLDKYYVEFLNDDTVRRFNSIIINNSNELALSNKSVIYYYEDLLKNNSVNNT